MAVLSRFHRRNSCVQFWTLAILFNFASASPGPAQQSSAATIAESIEQDRRTIQQEELQHPSDDRIGYFWAVLAADYSKAGEFSASEAAYFKALKLLDHSSTAARTYATALDNLAMLYMIYGRLDEAELYNRRSAKIRSGLGFPLDEARGEQHMAEIDLARRRFKAVEEEAARALAVMERLDDPEKMDIVSTLNSLAFARCSRRACEQGLKDAQRSLTLARSFFGDESAPAAHAWLAIGFAEWKQGRLDEADRAMRLGVQMIKAQEGEESRGFPLAMLEYRNFLKAVHRDRDAENVTREISHAVEQQSPMCATCVNVRSLPSNAMR
ncbi:MAG TPA: tetratricopeptide repeat protein [Edaphobacter sp.]|jgi:tetratricopeptide (TPR) repeat protein